MEGWLTFQELHRITKFVDAFCGTVEPSFRNVYFYYDKGLKIYATDGCAKLYLSATKEFLPFDGIASIPVQYIKGIIKGTKSNENSLVKISLEDKEMIFEIEGMRLNSKIEKEEAISIETSGESVVISKKELGYFIDKLDFVSASANEGDIIDILTHDKKIVFGYLSDYYKLNTFYSETKVDFHREIPFISARHIVKALNQLKKSNILELGIDKYNIILRNPGVLIKVCSSKPSFSKNILIFEKFIEQVDMNTKDLKNVLSKLYSTFSESNIAYLVLKENNSYIYKEEKNARISFKLPYSFQNQYLVPIHVRKLRSILARMDDHIKIYLNEKTMLLEDSKNSKKAIFLVQEFIKK
ncbi:hypothetical protein [Petrotoga sp. 9PWA.NaAc.5.4]|uniref:hypothetical protein n=1 Tax=Petrotoga sp. 9PWA.NaAc.5.4 TaxID=1434328 RepID=UPI000CC8DF59|nr:hypothetical protein [Petrotoga sp. 9PWA.NaAc.5.4]PNR93704.1 hypothetical protein X924_07690 [Petrotoga sp. 9PWA.NaAc.5.4]